MGSVSDRRWPVAPLMKCLGVVTPGELAAACGVGDDDTELVAVISRSRGTVLAVLHVPAAAGGEAA